jgi:hypothetical protein
MAFITPLPGDAHDLPGVHPAQAGNALANQIIVQGVLAAEIGGMPAQLPHDIAEQRAFPFKILLDHSVIADQGEGVGNDLAEVAGVGQRFQVPLHAGGEYQFPHTVNRGADAASLKNFAVAEH